MNWIAGAAPAGPIRASAQIRYRHPAAPAHDRAARPTAARACEFDAPQPAITPGQAVVFYDGDEVLGEGGSRLRSE